MAITSQSSTADVQAAYEDNISAHLTGDVAGATLCYQAGKILEMRIAKESHKDGEGIQENVDAIKRHLVMLEGWLKGQIPAAAGGKTRYSSLRNFAS